MIETRLDNVAFRTGFCKTRREARQAVSHGHFTVNGKRVNIPSYLVKAGDVIAVAETSKDNARFKAVKEEGVFGVSPKWLDVNAAELTAKVVALPSARISTIPLKSILSLSSTQNNRLAALLFIRIQTTVGLSPNPQIGGF